MQPPRRFVNLLPSLALIVLLLGVYLATLAPGLTWANYGADGGDLTAAVATGGVAHPTGYPTYLLLARLFQFLPIGSLAYRTNLLSGVLTAVAALFVYLLTIRFLAPDDPLKAWPAGLAAGIGFGLAPLVWSQAVITEVYALNALFVALLLFLTESPTTPRFTKRGKYSLLGLIFGLALGNHITIGFLFPVLFLDVFHRTSAGIKEKANATKLKLDWGSFLWMCLWVGIGSLVYASLPLRSLGKPPINWGNPVTPANFVWLVTGKLYQAQLLANPLSMILDRIRSVAGIFLSNFGLIGLTIGLVGLVVSFRPSRLYFKLLWITLAFGAFSVLYSTSDSFVYLIPALLCFSIWLGIGVSRILQAIFHRWKAIPTLTGIVILLILFIQAGLHLKAVDASKDIRAEAFAKDVLASAPADAMVFARGDQAIFSLWYYQYALHSRPDLAIMASDLLQFDWYLQTLRNTYPTMDLSEPFPFPETVIVMNPGRWVCYVEYVQLPVITCLPPRSLARP